MIEGNKSKGDSFEKLAYTYFHTDPKFQNIKNVWRQKDIPFDVQSLLGIPTNDIGIDLLLESIDGDFYPVQCKYHSDPNRAVGWKEASTFIGLLNSIQHFKAGYLCSNAYDVSSNYGKAHSGKPIVRLLGSIWDNVDSEPTADSRPELVPLKPRPHQQKAIDEAVEYFEKEENSRGKLIFPCGAGKSLTGFWITQELTAQSILIAVPSLALVKQTLEVYLREIAANKKQARWLCVCSDQEIGTNEEVKMHTSDLGVPCTTDPIEIRNWLTQPRKQQQIVFTTYQSGRLVADISKQEGIAFDLAILDEAHKTVGSTGKLFSYLLFDQNIEIRKRIFMTATERFYSGTKDDIVSMDDPEVYGEVFTQMTFKEAIDQQLLTDYKIITIDVAKKEIADFIRENKLVELDSKWGTETEARSLAAMIALRKAMKALPIRNAVSFHSSIAKAERNDKLQKHITATYNLPPISSYTVSGKMSTGHRDRIVSEFASKKGALITNARCLTEGVDVPNIDCIVFSDPRKSRIDIVQALGRALRRKEGKDWGYVILPVVYDGDTHEIDNDNFQEIISIIRGLAANDERIVEYFKDKQSIEITGGGELTNVQFAFLTELLEESLFQSEIKIKLWKNLSKFNWMPFIEARTYVRNLNLKNQIQWREYCGKNVKIFNIPNSPHHVYKQSGWLSWGDWLGTGRIASQKREYLNFNKARDLVRKLNLDSRKYWTIYTKSNSFRADIPVNPDAFYKETGWINWGDWLGTNNIAPRLREYLTFEQARTYVHSLKLKNKDEWKVYCDSGFLPENIPKTPGIVYKDKGWVSVGDWLGPQKIATQKRKYLSFEEARNYVQSLNLNSWTEWRNYINSKVYNIEIPRAPERVYINTGWISRGDWLGTGQTSNKNRSYLNFEEARFIVRSLNLKSQQQWTEFSKSNLRPKEIPSHPHIVYKNKGWINLNDWIGTKSLNRMLKGHLPYLEARKFVRTLKLKSVQEWVEYSRSNLRPAVIPTKPNVTYKNSGWKNMSDWLGTTIVPRINRQYLGFFEARDFVHKLELKNTIEWRAYSKSSLRPLNIPGRPQATYKDEGWISMGDWLGTHSPSTRGRTYLPFAEARKFVRKLNLKNMKEWRLYYSSNDRPEHIPSDPARIYKEQGWLNFGDWLGNDNVSNRKRIFLNFEESKTLVHQFGFKDRNEWNQFSKSGARPADIPARPDIVFKNKGWQGWSDFLG